MMSNCAGRVIAKKRSLQIGTDPLFNLQVVTRSLLHSGANCWSLCLI